LKIFTARSDNFLSPFLSNKSKGVIARS
jgi:hypothetical protein